MRFSATRRIRFSLKPAFRARHVAPCVGVELQIHDELRPASKLLGSRAAFPNAVPSILFTASTDRQAARLSPVDQSRSSSACNRAPNLK